MEKMVLFFFFTLMIPTGFTGSVVINNNALNLKNDRKSTIAVQWATSAKEIEHSNKSLQNEIQLNPDKLRVLTQTGKNKLDVPQHAEYFRVLVWSNSTGKPEFITNWIDIELNKTYTLNKEHLVPIILMTGTGC